MKREIEREREYQDLKAEWEGLNGINQDLRAKIIMNMIAIKNSDEKIVSVLIKVKISDGDVKRMMAHGRKEGKPGSCQTRGTPQGVRLMSTTRRTSLDGCGAKFVHKPPCRKIHIGQNGKTTGLKACRRCISITRKFTKGRDHS